MSSKVKVLLGLVISLATVGRAVSFGAALSVSGERGRPQQPPVARSVPFNVVDSVSPSGRPVTTNAPRSPDQVISALEPGGDGMSNLPEKSRVDLSIAS